jgi:hypothetical protein
MKTRIKAKPRVANDNGEATTVVSLTERRERAARRRAAAAARAGVFVMRDWAPAILATFFGGGSRRSD